MRKKDIVEDLNNAIIDVGMTTYEKNYREQLNALQAKAVELVGKDIRPTIAKLSKGFRVTGININTRGQFIIAGTQLLVQNPKLKSKLPELAKLMSLYSVNNPLLYADKVNKIVKVIMGAKIPLNPRETKALRNIDIYMKQNSKQIQKLVDQNTKALKVINKQITTNQSRAIIKRRNKLIKERITVNGVKRPLTNEEIAKRLTSEFKNDKARINRILDTEVHRQTELVGEATAKAYGFRFKIWNTQRDSRVRDSHAKLQGKRVRINGYFNVGGHKASFPGDARLPADESINCRCFLTYE